MTISTVSSKVIALGDGTTTVFDYSFPMPTTGAVYIFVTDAEGNVDELDAAQYTITGIGDPDGGTVTYPLAGDPLPDDGSTITIQRILPYQQLTDLVNQGGFYPDTVESALDYLMMCIQQVIELAGGSLQLPAVIQNLSMVLPANILINRQPGQSIIVNNAGDGFTLGDPATAGPVSINNVTATSYTLTSDDNQAVVNMVNGGTVTVPAGLTIGHCTGITSGDGAVDVVNGAGATLNVAASFAASLNETFSFATVMCTATSEWLLYGDLTLA